MNRRDKVLFIAVAVIAAIAIMYALPMKGAAQSETIEDEPTPTELIEEPVPEIAEIEVEPIKPEPEPVATVEAEPEEEPTPEPIEEEPEPEPEVDPDELEWLAITIYQEGGADYVCDECRYRIGDVVLNRISSDLYPDTMEGVLTEKQQYGRFYWTGIKWAARASNPGEKMAVERAWETAYNLLTDARHSDLYGEGYIYQAEFPQGTDVIKCCGIYYGR